MPISATGIWTITDVRGNYRLTLPIRRGSGFTLIELLVALVIIGVVTSIALISLGSLGKQPVTQNAAQRFAALARFAADDAVVEGREIGIVFHISSYDFVAFTDQGWTPITDDPVFRERKIDSSIQLDLQLEGRPIVLNSKDTMMAANDVTKDTNGLPTDANNKASDSTSSDKSADNPGQQQPAIVFLSSGELTPFRLYFTGAGEHRYAVTGSLENGIKLVSPDGQTGNGQNP